MVITDSEKVKIEESRSLVKDELTPYYDTDFNLLRWLKGHNSDLNIIVPKLKSHLKFRRSDWNLDILADRKRDHPVHAHWNSVLTGEAKLTKNTIVNIEQSGGNDYWGMMKTHPMNETLRARVHDLESMLRAVMEMEKRTGEQCSVLYFMDLSGLVMDRHNIPLLTGGLASISAFMAEHYVELVQSFVLVNVPTQLRESTALQDNDYIRPIKLQLPTNSRLHSCPQRYSTCSNAEAPYSPIQHLNYILIFCLSQRISYI